jgi:dTDP-4-dehydrorhamnose 3,5-epimerase
MFAARDEEGFGRRAHRLNGQRMQFEPTSVEGCYRIRLPSHADARGRFKRRFCRREFAAAGLETDFVQMNHSITLGSGTLRGMHYQEPPAAETKLVSCTFGRAFDVAVDLRAGSSTFLQWEAIELDESTMFYIPEGCAHGFQALSDEVHLVYLHSRFFQPEAERGLRFDDPAVGIEWPLPIGLMSDRDRSFPALTSSFQGVSR